MKYKISPNSHYSCNHNYFDTITPAASFVAGVFASDGCIWTGTTHGKVVGIHLCDEQLVKYVRQELEAEHPVGVRHKQGRRNLYKLEINSSSLYSGLFENYNITEKKSFTYNPPNLDKNNSLSFAKGLFLGDGSVHRKSQSKHISCSFVGSYKTVEWFQNLVCDTFDISKNKMYVPNKYSPFIYVCAWNSKNDAQNLYWGLHDLDVGTNGERLTRHLSHPSWGWE